MLAIGAADDCRGALGMAEPLDVLEYLRCTRPYFVTCRRAVDEDACLKQGKTRLTIIRRNIRWNQLLCRCRLPLVQGGSPRFRASIFRAFADHPASCLLQSILRTLRNLRSIGLKV
jgi:hypothetical protein